MRVRFPRFRTIIQACGTALRSIRGVRRDRPDIAIRELGIRSVPDFVAMWFQAAISCDNGGDCTIWRYTMANKDKGTRATKKAPAKDLKQKRLDKKAKKRG